MHDPASTLPPPAVRNRRPGAHGGVTHYAGSWLVAALWVSLKAQAILITVGSSPG